MNPFADWKDGQQCKSAFALDGSGMPVYEQSARACKFCAFGWLSHKDEAFRMHFANFLVSEFGRTIVDLNDVDDWKPAQFREAWDRCFEESRAK